MDPSVVTDLTDKIFVICWVWASSQRQRKFKIHKFISICRDMGHEFLTRLPMSVTLSLGLSRSHVWLLCREKETARAQLQYAQMYCRSCTMRTQAASNLFCFAFSNSFASHNTRKMPFKYLVCIYKCIGYITFSCFQTEWRVYSSLW